MLAPIPPYFYLIGITLFVYTTISLWNLVFCLVTIASKKYVYSTGSGRSTQSILLIGKQAQIFGLVLFERSVFYAICATVEYAIFKLQWYYYEPVITIIVLSTLCLKTIIVNPFIVEKALSFRK
jgi:hypothetical protein